MSQHTPGPQQPQPPYGQPGYGYPQQPGPYRGGPAPYQPPPPPKKGMSGGAIVAIVLGSVFGGLFLLLGLGAALSDNPTSTKKPATTEAAEKVPVKKDNAADAKPADKPAAEPAEPAPVQVTATKTTFKPHVFNDGGDFTSVQVTVVNNSDEKIRVSLFYFAITDTTGMKHKAEYGEDKHQIDSMDLAPGEKATGTVTGTGKFTPKYVTYTEGWFGEDIRADVS